jgi:hypothetical protein
MKRVHYMIAAAVAVASAATAAPPPVDPSVLPLFQKTCISGELTRAGLEAAIVANGGWTADPAPPPNFDQLGTVKSLSPIYDFKKPENVKSWSRTVDGKVVRVVLADYPPKKSAYTTVCALLVPNVKNGMAYFDGVRDLMKSVGLKGKSTDLPHYVEFSGKLADGRKARGDLFSRSQVTGERETMHIYIAF